MHSTSLFARLHCSFNGQWHSCPGTCLWRIPVTLRRGFCSSAPCSKRCIGIYLLGIICPMQVTTKNVDKSCQPRPFAWPHTQSYCLGSKLEPTIQGSSGDNLPFVTRRRDVNILKRMYIIRHFHASFALSKHLTHTMEGNYLNAGLTSLMVFSMLHSRILIVNLRIKDRPSGTLDKITGTNARIGATHNVNIIKRS